jgi:acyl-coenzyme A synthetase/AMP-(fatty) acid ligase
VPAGVPIVSEVAALPAGATDEPSAVWDRQELSSIFFSSGSTGKPKGVQHAAKIWYEFMGIQHCEDSGPGQYEQPLNPVTWCDGFWHGAVTWYSNWTAISDVFNGIPVIIIDHDTLMNPEQLQGLRMQHGLTTMYFSPAHLRAIVEEKPECLSDLTLIYVWGEKLSESLVEIMAEKCPNAQMVDWFGTSETFMGIHRRLLPSAGGLESAHWRADNDTELLLVDPTDHSIRVDELNKEGEIMFIRPDHVTMCMGYLDNQELTDERFVPNPHGEGIMYKTGDLGMWITPDSSKQQPGHCRCRFCVARDGDPGTRGTFDSPETGTGDRVGVLTVVGRLDFQVKIRAQMVNLEHVDTSAKQIPGVQDAGTLPYTDAGGDTAIILYVQKFDNVESFDELRTQIREGLLVALPDYAVPTMIEEVAELPRTSTGKLKRRGLPSVPVQEYNAPPDNPTLPFPERILGIVRRKVRAPLELEDSWLEFGGNSLSGMAIIGEIKTLFEVDVPTTALFKDPVVASIADAVTELMGGGANSGPAPIMPRHATPAIIPTPMPGWNTSCMLGGPSPTGAGPVPLNYQTVSYSIWITDGEDGTQFQREWFKQALWEVHARHEALRGHFLKEDGQLQFQVASTEEFVLPLVERDLVAEDILSDASDEEKEAKAVAIAEELYKFDGCFEPFNPFLGRKHIGEGPKEGGLGPLAHFYLLRVTPTKWYFFYGMHHSIFDGYSDEIFWTDLNQAYLTMHNQAHGLPSPDRELPPPVHYPDFALWQAESVFPTDEWATAIKDSARMCFSSGAATAPPPDKAGVPCESKIRHSVWYRGGPWCETNVGIPPNICETLSTLAQSEGGTLFMAMVAAFHVWQHKHQPDKAEAMMGVTLLGRPESQPGLKRVIGNFQEASAVRTPLASCVSFMDVLRATKNPFLHMNENANEGAAVYDHASWASMLSDTPRDELPSEVAEYLYARPKAFMNFQDMGYGESTTAGLTAAGLRAWNSVEPVSKEEYAGADAASTAADAAATGAPVAAAAPKEQVLRMGEDGTVWVLGEADAWEMPDEDTAEEILSAQAGAAEAAAGPSPEEASLLSAESIEVCDAYLYPSLTPGDYGERADDQGHRDINDYELYFSFLRGAAATETEPRHPDSLYLGFDSEMYSDERAKVRRHIPSTSTSTSTARASGRAPSLARLLACLLACPVTCGSSAALALTR